MTSERGQTLVEFALILPILLVLVIGIFDFGSAFNSKNNLNFIANSAARFAEVDSCAPCGNQSIASYVKSTADTGQLSSSVSITFCLPSGTSNVGDPLQVTATAPFNWLGANLPGLPTTAATLTSRVTVRILQAPSPGDPLYTPTQPPC